MLSFAISFINLTKTALLILKIYSMKRTILLIFIALITAIGCQAQEADATKTTRYNNRHTMDGYKAFYEAGYFWGIDDQNGPHLPNKFSVTTSQGFQLNNFVYLGLGVGVDSYRHNENCYVSVPLFADLRVNCLNDKRVMPFFDIRMGYSMGDRARGFYWENQLGVRIGMKKHHAVYAAADFTFQYCSSSIFIIDTDLGDYVALGFKVGYEF